MEWSSIASHPWIGIFRNSDILFLFLVPPCKVLSFALGASDAASAPFLALLALPPAARGLCSASSRLSSCSSSRGESQQTRGLRGGWPATYASARLRAISLSSRAVKKSSRLFLPRPAAGVLSLVFVSPFCPVSQRPSSRMHAAECRHLCVDSTSSSSSFGSASRMADHFALMTGRLLTESTLRSTIHEAVAVAVPSTTAGYGQPDPSAAEGVQEGKAKSGVMVECRICQEEGDEAYMEMPCSCKGSLKYAHHRCVQRWCNEKGDTFCEICLQKFAPNYTAPLKLFRHGRNRISFRRAGERPQNRGTTYSQTTDQVDGASSYDSQSFNLKAVIYCRVVAIVLMTLLVLRDAISLILGGPEACSIELITLLMFRTAGIVIPVYIIMISVIALLHRCNQQQAMHETPVSELGGAGGLQAMPLQQQQHIITIR